MANPRTAIFDDWGKAMNFNNAAFMMACLPLIFTAAHISCTDDYAFVALRSYA